MRWFEAEPARLRRELVAMRRAAPDLEWDAAISRSTYQDGGGWQGTVPIWPFDRPAPEGLQAFLAGQRLEVVVVCRQAHPAVQPIVFPITPEPALQYRTDHAWHVSGDGSLCLTQRAYDWTGAEMAAELVVKSAGWLIEFLLITRGVIERMTEVGIAARGDFDHLIVDETSTVTEPAVGGNGAHDR